MPIRAVIFDIGGVLLLEKDTGMDAKWEQRLGLKKGELTSILFGSTIPLDATLGKLPEQELWNQVGTLFGIDDEQAREFRDDTWGQYEPNSELAQFLKSLRPRYKTALLTNDEPGGREVEHQRFKLDELVNVVARISSAEEKMMKPDVRFFLLACERLGVQPEEVVFLDNIEENVEAARGLGMQGIHFKNTAQAIADVQACLDSQPTRA